MEETVCFLHGKIGYDILTNHIPELLKGRKSNHLIGRPPIRNKESPRCVGGKKRGGKRLVLKVKVAPTLKY